MAKTTTAVGLSDREIHGPSCIRIARNILDNMQEAEACVEQALRLAQDQPPASLPSKPEAYFGKLTRGLALDVFASHKAAKRGNSMFQSSLDELNQCIPSGSTGFGSGFDEETESARIGAAINRFLRKQRREVRDVFLCRYFYAESIGEITRRFGLSESKVNHMLLRTRIKLRRHLESEGIRL